MNFFSRILSWHSDPHAAKAAHRAAKSPPRPRSLKALEELEDRCLLNSTLISGYVFLDVNNDGIFQAGESPLANSHIELLNSKGVIVGTATTGSNGLYQFTYDSTISTAPQTESFTHTFNTASTNLVQVGSLPQFNPALGTLTEIDISINGQITSDIRVENMDSSPAVITGTVAGDLNVTGPDFNQTFATTSQNQTFDASAYDGTLDFGGTSGKNFGNVTVPGSSAFTMTSAGELAAYSGTGNVTIDEEPVANSSATGGGNLDVQIASNGSATITVTYHYIPENNLPPGAYTIVQMTQPPGTLPGKVSSGGVVLPGSFSTRTIPVTLPANGTSTNNNFGEVLPAAISGYVYYDVNNDGVLEAGEPGIGGASVTLTGTDINGNPVSLTQTTNAGGYYSFSSVMAGTYSLTEKTPSGYIAGKDAAGSLGGVVGSNTISSVSLAMGANGLNYDFGNLLPADMAIVKTVYPSSVNTGQAVTYTLTVTNYGPATAQGIVVRDPLPAGETFLNASGPGWTCTQANGTITCTIASMADGASSVITINADAPQTGGTYTNTATVSATTPDTNLSNNSSSATLLVNVISPTSGSTQSIVASPRDLSFLSKVQFLTGGSGAVSSSPSAYVLSANHVLYRYTMGSGYTPLGAGIASIKAVTESNGTVVVYAVMLDNSLFRYDPNSGWSQLGGAGTIAAISAGTDANGNADVYVMTSNTAFYQYSVGGGWQMIGNPGSIASFAAADQGRVYAVTADQSLFGFSNQWGWYRLTSAGFARSIAVSIDASDNVVEWVITTGGALYRHIDATGWTLIQAANVQAISAGTDATGHADVFAVMNDGSLNESTSTSNWLNLSGAGTVSAVSAADNDVAYVVTTNGTFQEFDGQYGWLTLSSPGFAA